MFEQLHRSLAHEGEGERQAKDAHIWIGWDEEKLTRVDFETLGESLRDLNVGTELRSQNLIGRCGSVGRGEGNVKN